MRSIQAGKLRHVAVFKRPVRTEHASGETKVTSYTTLQTMRAAFEQLERTAGAEPVHAEQVVGRTLAKVTTRYFSGLLTSDMVTLDSVDYEILAIDNTENLNRQLVCTVVAVDKAS